MDPKDILYEKVNTFFLQRPSLDLHDIPMFYVLSNSGEHFEQEVSWLLDIIVAGMNDPSVSSIGFKLIVDFEGNYETSCN
jgi:Nucleolar pre-ribosomal-associated protein 1